MGQEKKNKVNWSIFGILLGLLLADRILTLVFFGYVYTDVDQMILWNGAMDYSNGIFHEPFFYGQPYNYMLEAFLAAPLLKMGIPVYLALPTITSLVSIFPFVFLAIFLMKKERYFWAFLCLTFPLLLPLSYNLLTTISRGFIQAHFFVPLLFIPLLNPKNKRNIPLLFIASALCFFMNQSSVILLLPVFLYVYSYHYKFPFFYLNAFWIVPFYVLDFYAKEYYVIHPERGVYGIWGTTPNWDTFLLSLKSTYHFDYLFPYISNWGIVYPFVFLVLLLVAIVKWKKKPSLFIGSFFILLLVTLAIPKVQTLYYHGGIFYTPSRLYLFLPIVFILSLFLLFKHYKWDKKGAFVLLVIGIVSFCLKNYTIQKSVEGYVKETGFPVTKNIDLILKAEKLEEIVAKKDIGMIIHDNKVQWDYVFDSYAYNPLNNPHNEKIISVNLNGDRRTWIYSDSVILKRVLLNGIELDSAYLNVLDFEILNENQILLRKNGLPIKDLIHALREKSVSEKQ